ncbi:fused nitric oxide dioxygenase and dihydropteridine reductase [Psychromonas ingrahamii 37]|uniref:Flavohemoprotein n=1 Tax=Psychromonas ingrahamii (strain DSM 17664 / CCUG 51855 / 37) TaxID=357804 RepID=A1SYP4_PSYIN|nr:NO-inducible flavohemoprotein [Psychromonas ingrahamii]ABM04609.1 fused nitric oxide dioxygenase and dihydropteridine reductase [Psychromonas ingrahamii 37]
MLTQTEINIIKDSAPALAQYGEDITGRFYQILFQSHPELSHIFNMTNQKSGSQKAALATAVYAFAKYVDNLEVILGDVERIAQKHASLGIKSEHYPLVGSALLQAIDEILQPPQSVIDAWAKGYGILADVFINREQALYDQKSEQQGGWRGTREFTLVNKVMETPLITSFYLKPNDGLAISDFVPGQYIAVHMQPAGAENHQIRQYSLSSAYNKNSYRISVKKEQSPHGEGLISNYLHDSVNVGDTLNLSNPFGEFYLQESSNPVVLISGGVGITPMQAMLETLVSGGSREVHFVHGALNSEHHAYKEMHNNITDTEQVTTHVFYEQAPAEPADNHYQGLINLELLKSDLPLNSAEFYLCGPLAMMKAVYKQLKTLQVADENIFYEVFGASKALAE